MRDIYETYLYEILSYCVLYRYIEAQQFQY